MEVRRVWITKLRFKPEIREKVGKVLDDVEKTAKSKGEYFTYTILGNFAFINSDSKDRAYKRGMWFRHKVDESISFEVSYK